MEAALLALKNGSKSVVQTVIWFAANWALWFVRATKETFAFDVGPHYQGGVVFLWSLGIVLAFAMPMLMYFTSIGGGWESFLIGLFLYFFVGLLEFMYSHKWGMLWDF